MTERTLAIRTIVPTTIDVTVIESTIHDNFTDFILSPLRKDALPLAYLK